MSKSKDTKKEACQNAEGKKAGKTRKKEKQIVFDKSLQDLLM